MPFQAIEHQMGIGWKNKTKGGQPPELGAMLYAINFVLSKKNAVNERQLAAQDRGNKLLRIFPELNKEQVLIKKLSRLVSSQRNPASHGVPISLEKLEKSRKELFQREILRDFLSKLVE